MLNPSHAVSWCEMGNSQNPAKERRTNAILWVCELRHLTVREFILLWIRLPRRDRLRAHRVRNFFYLVTKTCSICRTILFPTALWRKCTTSDVIPNRMRNRTKLNPLLMDAMMLNAPSILSLHLVTSGCKVFWKLQRSRKTSYSSFALGEAGLLSTERIFAYRLPQFTSDVKANALSKWSFEISVSRKLFWEFPEKFRNFPKPFPCLRKIPYKFPILKLLSRAL